MTDLIDNVFYGDDPKEAARIVEATRRYLSEINETLEKLEANGGYDDYQERIQRLVKQRRGFEKVIHDYEAICWHMLKRLLWLDYETFVNEYPINNQTTIKTLGVYLPQALRNGGFFVLSEPDIGLMPFDDNIHPGAFAQVNRRRIDCKKWYWGGHPMRPVYAMAGYDDETNMLYFQLV